jgi:hypothetical protein
VLVSVVKNKVVAVNGVRPSEIDLGVGKTVLKKEMGSGVFVGSTHSRAEGLLVQLVSGIFTTMGGATCA